MTIGSQTTPEHDFGPTGHSYRTIIQHRPEGGMAYRYGRPQNAVTLGFDRHGVPADQSKEWS